MKPWWMRYIRLAEEPGGDGAAGGGGSADEEVLDDPARGGEGGDDAPDPAAEDSNAPDMLKAIREGLERARTEERVEKPAPAKEAEADGTEAAKKADGEPAKPAKKAATAEDFALDAQQLSVLKESSRQRFQGLHAHAKELEARVAAQTEEMTGLTQARDTILGVLEDAQCEPDDLTGLLVFNKLVKTGKYEDALALVEGQRTALLKMLGREAPGYDPLDEHPDLKSRVDALDLSREDALALANSRRIERARADEDGERQRVAERAGQTKAAQDRAIADIERWSASKTADRDFAQKQKLIEPRLKAIIARYPPHLWVSVIDEIYNSIAAPASVAKPEINGGMRPSGQRGGTKAPGDMHAAIREGLGYST